MTRQTNHSIDDVIRELNDDLDWHSREYRWKTAAVEHLQALRDGEYLTPVERSDLRQMETAFQSRHRQDRHRQPPRPDFGGAS